MIRAFIDCLKRGLIHQHGFKHVTITSIYQKGILEFIGYKKTGEEFKGIAKLYPTKKRIIVKGYSVNPYAPFFIKNERTYSFHCDT